MLPDPLHPAVVHFPIVFAVLLPVVAIATLVAVRRGARRRMWLIPILLGASLTGSAWFAMETGEAQEDRVESVVSRSVIHGHEERAERFLVASGVVLVVLAGGLVGGAIGSASRLVGTFGTVLLLIPAVQVGASGGALVYEHGAGQAYVTQAASATGEAPAPEAEESGDRDRER